MSRTDRFTNGHETQTTERLNFLRQALGQEHRFPTLSPHTEERQIWRRLPAATSALAVVAYGGHCPFTHRPMHSQRGRRLQGDFDEASTGGSAAVSPRTRQGREDPLSRALSRGEAQTPDGPAEPASRLPSALPPDTHRPAAFTGTAGEGEEGPSYGFATPTGAQRGLSRPVGLRSRPRAAAHAMWATPTVAGSRPASRQHTPAHSALWGRREQLITEISSIDSKLRRHKTLGSAGMASLERSSSAGVMAEASSVGAARARAPLSRTRER